jgi:hypothetical protein
VFASQDVQNFESKEEGGIEVSINREKNKTQYLPSLLLLLSNLLLLFLNALSRSYVV